MITSVIREIFHYRVERIWEVVTSPENYGWRRDIGRTEILSPDRFVEYTRQGFSTTFAVTTREEYQRWEFDLENENMKGHWTGIFEDGGERTAVEFCEEIYLTKRIMTPLAKIYIKKQQINFMEDLRRELDR